MSVHRRPGGSSVGGARRGRRWSPAPWPASRRRSAAAGGGRAWPRPAAGRAAARAAGSASARLAVLALAAAGPAASVPGRPRGRARSSSPSTCPTAWPPTTWRPTRLAAAQQAAGAFVDAQPDSVDIGVVAFQNGGADHLPAQRRPRRRRRTAIDRLDVAGGTSLGQAHPRLAVGDHRQAGRLIGTDGTVPGHSGTGARRRSCCSPTARTPAAPDADRGRRRGRGEGRRAHRDRRRRHRRRRHRRGRRLPARTPRWTRTR